MFVNKNYTYTRLNCLKFNSALNDPKTIQPTNQPKNLKFLVGFIFLPHLWVFSSLSVFVESWKKKNTVKHLKDHLM